jgi:hypothetical protein
MLNCSFTFGVPKIRELRSWKFMIQLPSFYRAILCNFIVILIWELCVSKDAIVVNFHPSTAMFCTEMFLGTLTVVLNAYPYVQKHQRQRTRVVLIQCYLCLILRLHVSLL